MICMNRIVLMSLMILLAAIVACSRRVNLNNISSVFSNDGALVGVSSDDSKLSVLAFEKTFMLVGYNQAPYMLSVSPEFDINAMQENIKESLLQVKFISFRPPFYGDTGRNYHRDFLCRLKEFRTAKTVQFEGVKIEDWQCLKDSPAQCVIFERQEITNRSDLLNVLCESESLKYLVHDRVFSKAEINTMQQKAPHIVVLNKSQYEKKVKAGEIIP